MNSSPTVGPRLNSKLPDPSNHHADRIPTRVYFTGRIPKEFIGRWGGIVFGFQRTYRLWELKKRQTGAAHAAPIASGQRFVFFDCVACRTSRSLISRAKYRMNRMAGVSVEPDS